MNSLLLDQSLAQLHQDLVSKKITITDLIDQAYDQIEKNADSLNIFTFIRPKEEVIKEAKQKQAQLSDASSQLFGLPYVLKDSYLTQGIPTTASSDVLKDFIPPYSATVVEKLQSAGAILIAKCNMDAWGHGASSDNTDFGPAKNPFDPTRSPGGSTGGVAAALACRMAAFGIGEDTGGSIRNPSAHNNITGLKVSYGRVSRYGCIAYASSFDTVGPMAKTAKDCAIVLETIAGIDKYDATSSPNTPSNYSKDLKRTPKKLTIGIPKQMLSDDYDSQVYQSLIQAKDTLEDMGHQLVEFDMPALEFGLSVYYLIGPSETSSNLGRYDGIRYGQDRSYFTNETIRRILTGTYALSAGYYDQYYRKAQKVRTLLIQAYQKTFQDFDVLLMPVNPTPPPKIGELISDPVTNMLADIFTITHNIVGIPSLALPAGFTKSGLPIGIQISAPMFAESLLLSLGNAYQDKTNFHQQKPEII